MLHDELVPGIGEKEDLELALAEHFEVGAALRGGPVRGKQAVDLLLLGGHPLDVIGQRRELALVEAGGLEPEQLAQPLLVRVIGHHPLLEEPLVFAVEPGVGLRVLLRLLIEEFEELAGQDLVQPLQERGVLHRLAGDVEREILAVDDPLEKAEPFGEEPLGFSLDEYLPAVQVHLGLHPPHAHRFEVPLRHEEQGLDGDRGVRVEMQPEERLVMIVPDESVKLVVLLLLDLILAPGPNRLDRVEPLGVQLNGKRDEAGITLDDPLDG